MDPNGRLSSGPRDQLIERGEGVPLFLEEFTRYALEAARTGRLPDTLPPGLSNTLFAGVACTTKEKARTLRFGPFRDMASPRGFEPRSPP